MANRVGMQDRDRPIDRTPARAGRSGPDRVPDADRLKPVIAGARARGMADALDALGVAAIMLDRAGMALHASSPAAAYLGAAAGKGLSLTAQTLIAAEPGANRALQRAVADVVGGEGAESRCVTLAESGLRLVVRPILATEGDPYQLLRALIVIESAG
jgi:hypothetical protein